MRQEHRLKIAENYLQAKRAGDKLFEIRRNDREYQKGDTTIYIEHLSEKETIEHHYEITYVTSYAQQGDYVVFGERHLHSGGAGKLPEFLPSTCAHRTSPGNVCNHCDHATPGALSSCYESLCPLIGDPCRLMEGTPF